MITLENFCIGRIAQEHTPRRDRAKTGHDLSIADQRFYSFLEAYHIGRNTELGKRLERYYKRIGV